MKKKILKRQVYIIQNKELPRIKIGFSRNPKSRMNSIMSQSGCFLELVYVTKPILNYEETEKAMHALFGEYRGIGEWFHVGAKLAINRLKDIYINNDNCKIVKHYNNGRSLGYISQALGLNMESIANYLIFRGIELKTLEKNHLSEHKLLG